MYVTLPKHMPELLPTVDGLITKYRTVYGPRGRPLRETPTLSQFIGPYH
jgi:hypothetical protein